MFKVFKRKSKTLSTPKKSASNRSSSSKEVPGVGDNVRPISYHFENGTTFDQNDDLSNTYQQNLDFRSFRGVDESGSESDVTVAKKNNPHQRSVSQERLPLSPRESPNDGVSADSFIRPSSSLDDLLEDSSSESKRKAPPPPRRYSSLSPDQPNPATLPRQSHSISERTGNDVASDSSYISNESGTPRLNGISSPPPPSTPRDSSNDQYQTHHSLTKSVSTFRPQNDTKTPNKPHVPSKPPHLQRSISEDLQASSPDDRTPPNEHRRSHQHTGGTPYPKNYGYTQKNGSGTHDADRLNIYSPESSRVNISSPASTGTHGVSDSESSASSDEPKADKTAQTFMESLMSSTSTSLPNVGVIQRNGKPHEGAAKEGVAKEVPNGQSSSQPATVMSFREAMKLRRVSEVQMMPQTPLTAQPVPLPTTPVALPNTPKSLPNTHVSKPNTLHSIPSHALPSHTTPSKATPTRSSTAAVEASDTPTPPPRKSRPKSRPPPPPTHPHTTVSYDFQTGRLEMVRSSSDVSTLSLTGSVSSISSPSELSSLSSNGSTTSPNASRTQHEMIKDTFISRSSPNVVPDSMEPSSVIHRASRDLLLRDSRLNDADGLSSETDMSMINSESESAMNSRKNRFHMLNQPNEVSEMYSKNDSDLNEGVPSLRSFRSISPVPNVSNDTDLDTQSELALDLDGIDDLDSDVTLESSLPIDDGPMNSSMLNESEMITISQSFINDSNTTYVSLLNGSQHNSVMVEDDYTPTNTPRSTTVREMTSDSWQKSLSQSWKPSEEDEIELCSSLEQPPIEQVANGENEGDDLQRDVVDDDVVIDDDDDVVDDDDDVNGGSEKKAGPARWASFHSDTSVLSVVDYAWQTKPAVEWDNDDIIEWCQYVEFDDLAEVLADCGIDGAGFLEITAEDLADLCVPEEQRVQILTEIQKLKSKSQHAEPLSYLKQTSMRRRDLEASSDAIQKRLSSLQQQNDRQQTQISTYLTELQQEQIRNTQLLSGETTQSDEETRRSPQPENTPVASSQRPMPSQRSSLLSKQESRDQMERQQVAAWQKRPLVRWSMRDVSEWLTATDLVQFEPTFREHGITGKDLAQIDMKLFDTLSIQDVDDRELILSCLYELQLSGGPVLDEIFHSANRSRSPSSYSSSSSTHSHHHLHAKGLSINDSANSDPGISRSPRSYTGHSTLSVPAAVSPVPSTSQHSTPAYKSGASIKLNSQDSSHSLDIWHDIRGNFQKTVVTMAASSASTGDVIEALQEKLHIVEDPNLFLLHTASLDPRYQDDIKELGRYECPLLLKELWPQGSNYRFEIKRRPGTDIQVTCHLPTVKSRSKTVTVSNGTTCLETIALVSRQFKLTSKTSWSSELCLLQAHEKHRHHDHVYSPTEDHELVTDIECDHFLLCEATAAHAITKHGLNKSQLSLSAKNSNQLAQMAEIEASLFCLDSDTTRDAATPLNDSHVTNTPSLDSGVASGAVTSVSDTDYTLDIDDLPLPVVPLSGQNHEDPYILNVANSVSGENKYGTPRSGSTHSDDVMGNSLELLQEIEVVKESVSERDITIANLQRQLQLQNDSIAESDEKYEKLEKMTSQQEKTWQDKCHRLQRELNRAKKVETYSDPHAKVDLLETELREITEQVQTQERNTKHMQQVMEKMKGANDRPVDKTGLAEHVHQLSRADATLQLLRHEQSDIASHLDIARKHLPNKQMPQYSLYELAKSVRTPLLVTCEVNVHPSVGFLHGRDQHGRLVVKQTDSSCDLQKGDKILEINNQAVTDLSDKEVTKTIRSTVDKLQMVVLREQPISKPLITKDELDGLKEDLALAVMELEAVQLENSDLNVDIVQLRGDYEALQDENSGLQTELSNLQSNEKRKKRSSQNSVTDDLNNLHADVNGD